MRIVHKKRGTVYEMVGHANVQCDRPLIDCDVVAVYKDAWGNKYLLERFTYQQAKAFCEKNEPPAGGSGPSPRYSILPARQS